MAFFAEDNLPAALILGATLNIKSEELNSEVLEKIEVLASRGLSQQDIAYCIGIHPTTLSEKKYENKQLQEALKRGKARGLAQITNALFEQALAGSTGAACFYLKNRDSENWTDTQSIKAEINVSKLSDSQLLDELRQDPVIVQNLKHFIPQLE